MGATSHKRWGKARVVDVCEVAQHVRQVVLEPERLDAPAPPGSHIDIGVYVNGRADVRSYSVVGSGAYGNRDHPRGAAGPAEPRRVGVHARRCAAASRCDHPAAAELPAELRPARLRAGRRRHRHHRPGRRWAGRSRPAARTTGSSTAPARASLMAFVDELVAEHGDRMDLRIDDEGSPLDVDELVDRCPTGGELYVCGPAPMLDAIKAAWAQAGPAPGGAAVRDLRQQRPVRPGGVPGAHPAARPGDHGGPTTCPCSRRWRPAAPT